jgi:hypothetical protein
VISAAATPTAIAENTTSLEDFKAST